MTTLTIRGLHPDVVARLKARARQNGRSMEQEAREILGSRLASRGELLSGIRSFWGVVANPPSAAEVSGWIEAGRRGSE